MKPTKPTRYLDIARDYALWGEWCPTEELDSEEQFNAMTVQQKLDILTSCFGADETDG